MHRFSLNLVATWIVIGMAGCTANSDGPNPSAVTPGSGEGSGAYTVADVAAHGYSPRASTTQPGASSLPIGASSSDVVAKPPKLGGPVPQPKNVTPWARGSTHRVQVASKLPASTLLVLEVSYDGGKTYNPDTTFAADDGFVLWQIPFDALDSALLRVTLQEGTVVATPGRVAIGPSQAANYAWRNLTDHAPFGPRDGAGAVVFNDRMVLIGGWNDVDPVRFPLTTANDVWSSTDGVNWRQDKPQTYLDDTFDANLDWAGRHTAGYAVRDGKMWILGGDATQGYLMNDVWNSSDGAKWSRVTAESNIPERVLGYHVLYNNKFWVMGGQTLVDYVAGADIIYNDIWSSTDGASYSKSTVLGPIWSARGGTVGSAVFQGAMWVVGGGVYEAISAGRPDRTYFADAWSSTDGANWQQHGDPPPWRGRMYHNVVVFDERLWVIGGYDEVGNENDVWYTKDGENWYELANSPWPARHAAVTWNYHGSLYYGSGDDEYADGEKKPDMWRLDRVP